MEHLVMVNIQKLTIMNIIWSNRQTSERDLKLEVIIPKTGSEKYVAQQEAAAQLRIFCIISLSILVVFALFAIIFIVRGTIQSKHFFGTFSVYFYCIYLGFVLFFQFYLSISEQRARLIHRQQPTADNQRTYDEIIDQFAVGK
uniref:Transmembrane protein n=1 Tax=Heterorhabditis bacteriophora TaxID=37862 RepID=A0A1I7XTE7_HETBA